MGETKRYDSAHAWRSDAMQRSTGISDAESRRRRKVAHAHNLQEGIHDADTLADQEMYIQGKMRLEEYQRYLLFKHSKT